jgi:ElaA protein
MIEVRGVQFVCKKFEDLTVHELYSILQARELVFTLEQQVFYKDLDDKDKYAYHLLGFKNEELVCYCRIIHNKSEVDEKITIGRVLTPPNKRKQGFGIQLVNQAIIVCKTLTDIELTIVAQAYLERFYSSFGFVKTSEAYMYEGIEHIDMKLNTRDVNIVNVDKSKIYANLEAEK